MFFYQVNATESSAGIAMEDYKIGKEMTIHGRNMQSGFHCKYSEIDDSLCL